MPVIITLDDTFESQALCTTTTVKHLLHFENPTMANDEDTFIDILIAGCSRAAENYCRRTFTQTAYTEYHDGDSLSETFRVRHPPIASSPAPEMWDDTNYSWGDTTKLTLNTDWKYDPNNGTVWLLYGVFSDGKQNVKITYTGGYSSIPDDIRIAIAMWVCDLYKDSRDTRWGLSGQTHTDYAINFTNEEIPKKVKKVLDFYRMLT